MERVEQHETAGGIVVRRHTVAADYERGTLPWAQRLDSERGAVFSSNYEYPGRYTRWDMAFVQPPLVLESHDRTVRLTALNARGEVLLPALERALETLDVPATVRRMGRGLVVEVAPAARAFTEEERSRQPSVFSVIRAVLAALRCDDPHVGLYGAFGYDVAFQFEPIERVLERSADSRDVVLYLPDELLVVDHHGRAATIFRYDFEVDGVSTEGLERTGTSEPFEPAARVERAGDHEPGEYAGLVRLAFREFEVGNLFEVVPGQVFHERCVGSPSAISKRLRETNPSPYSFLINLGRREYLVGASPEMYVRVTGRRVETCPISGTIRRGSDAIEDEAQIRKLLNSEKEMAELTMCSDVDRNDKSRVCVPGTVRVIGRRQIELYSRLIHTVDHIEGVLREGMDALDAFLSHTWAVTVTGAPKRWAMSFIEQHEKSPRAWYGGAVGAMYANGDMNTGLTLRTVHVNHGVASVRAGATLLFDSVPEEEEAETRLKASALLAAIREAGPQVASEQDAAPAQPGRGRRVLLVDHEDSFVHTLANYFRQTGAEVVTYRSPLSEAVLDAADPDLVVLSPGPGRPSDFDCSTTIRLARARGLPIFGVCLGMQAIVEALGGSLDQLGVPMHGKPSPVTLEGRSIIFEGLQAPVIVGRYHSLYAREAALPGELRITSRSGDGVVMSVEHRSEPIAAVQFHPESIMSLAQDAGHRMVSNVMRHLARQRGR